MNYQNRLIDIREERELSQQQMADILNVSRQNYSFWETGYKFIPLKHLNNFCNTFNCSMDYILKISNKNEILDTCELDKKIIGKKINEIRIKHNITQKELADFLNTTQSTISAYESGDTLILTSFAYQICTKYNISMDWLCNRKNKDYV